MGKIIRDPRAFSKKPYDVIIIGGGIYGVMLSLEAARRGYTSLVLERGDFGGATTFNSLRILHGGFRYLQTMDLYRFYESVAERRWFLTQFPGLVHPLPCLMPLYGDGLRRPSILRIAARINDLLSYNRNKALPAEKHLLPTRVLSVEKTLEIVPFIDRKNLKGAVVWHDAFMPDSQRIVMEALRAACGNGANALNYVEAVGLVKMENEVAGVNARDLESGISYRYEAKVVINAAGPWCRQVAARFDRDLPDLYKASVAWNILFNKPRLAPYALAVAPKKDGARTYFLLPFKGRLLAGTGHAPWGGGYESASLSDDSIQGFIGDLNLAVPSLDVNPGDILRVFKGFLPAVEDGSAELSSRERIVRHDDYGGPRGLYSVSGVKFTTARRVAEKAVKTMFSSGTESVRPAHGPLNGKPRNSGGADTVTIAMIESMDHEQKKDTLQSIVKKESVRHLDDLILRRTALWEHPEGAAKIVHEFQALFDWDDARWRIELDQLNDNL